MLLILSALILRYLLTRNAQGKPFSKKELLLEFEAIKKDISERNFSNLKNYLKAGANRESQIRS